MIPHCAYCRFNSLRGWDIPDNRCKGLDRAPGSTDPPRPCREADEHGTTYQHFSPVDEVCAEDALDHLLVEFDRLAYRLAAVEEELRLAEKSGLRLVSRRACSPIEWPEED